MREPQRMPGFIAVILTLLITVNYFVAGTATRAAAADAVNLVTNPSLELGEGCLLYTSDAADE